MKNVTIKSKYNSNIIKEAKAAGLKWDSVDKVWTGVMSDDKLNWFLDMPNKTGYRAEIAAIESIDVDGLQVWTV